LSQKIDIKYLGRARMLISKFNLTISLTIIAFAFILIKSKLIIEAFILFTTILFAIINTSFAMQAKSTLINIIFDIIETLFNSIN
jgi:hypothetical protein